MTFNAQYQFSHEQLDCYRLAVEVARWMRKAQFPQLRRVGAMLNRMAR